ncbi:MAG TPA: hypothetical protein DCF68_19425 [Cyanothece sp. UBA12306]|nr:hypothetical protein [Cyanothece sp. UBA12306]
MRSLKSLLTVGFILGLIFIWIGDSFLPKPLSTVSRNTRTKINNVLLGFTPDPKIKNPNRQFEEKAEDTEAQLRGYK